MRKFIVLAIVAVWIGIGLQLLGVDPLGMLIGGLSGSPPGPKCTDCRTVEVTRIIDGDTLDSSVGRIRLYGVDTPERGENCFSEATERLRNLAGDEIRVESGPREKDPFDRLLYYVYASNGTSIDAVLVAEGYGRAWTQDGQHRELMVELENSARMREVGCLW